jgi:hypothetical protein
MGISNLSPTMKPERWDLIFYILGGATCIWAFADSFLLPDSPSSAHFLNQRERVIAVKRVASNDMGDQEQGIQQEPDQVEFLGSQDYPGIRQCLCCSYS